jgi:hypothetical protein
MWSGLGPLGADVIIHRRLEEKGWIPGFYRFLIRWSIFLQELSSVLKLL